jgi:hypothetical protein
MDNDVGRPLKLRKSYLNFFTLFFKQKFILRVELLNNTQYLFSIVVEEIIVGFHLQNDAGTGTDINLFFNHMYSAADICFVCNFE